MVLNHLFKTEYWDNKDAGICRSHIRRSIVFLNSQIQVGYGMREDFYRTLDDANIVEKADRGIWGTRSEVRSLMGNAHLGHVFNDGPAPTGLRYCMNSAAMKFVPVAEMSKAGYADYLYLFESSVAAPDKEIAYLAGGCFWGMEQVFERSLAYWIQMLDTAGGRVDSPTYADVGVTAVTPRQ